ncbi:vegetative cell wall protein gp1-like [Cryptomeria japonica]|uniref:vegetative cell wall protein gp1-like n=1 Tax=Cryptomeria japonica TaxID=3369 RepID=UPI0027DA67A1|nr:vegetative cell wall protein gp1-like [Cryptomeria japonica]
MYLPRRRRRAPPAEPRSPATGYPDHPPAASLSRRPPRSHRRLPSAPGPPVSVPPAVPSTSGASAPSPPLAKAFSDSLLPSSPASSKQADPRPPRGRRPLARGQLPYTESSATSSTTQTAQSAVRTVRMTSQQEGEVFTMVIWPSNLRS